MNTNITPLLPKNVTIKSVGFTLLIATQILIVSCLWRVNAKLDAPFSPSSNDTGQTVEINNQLRAIKESLSNFEKVISSKIKAKEDREALEPIQEAFNQLQEKLNLEHTKGNELQESIKSSEETLRNKLEDISHIIDQQEKSKEKKEKAELLTSKALPFNVLSLDVIGELVVAVVAEHGVMTTLSEEDVLSGWKLSKAEFDNQKLIFESKNGQRAEVDLTKERALS